MSKICQAMDIVQFAELYETSENNIHAQKSNGRIPTEAFVLNGKRAVAINARYFYRRWDFIRKVTNSNHDLYYLLVEYFPVQEIAETISKKYGGSHNSIAQYLNVDMFTKPDAKLKTTLPKNAWYIYKYYRAIERRLKRRGASIAKILDKRILKYEMADRMHKDLKAA